MKSKSTKELSERITRMAIVSIFAIAFAFVESAVVIYLRKLLNIEVNYHSLVGINDISIAFPGIAFLQSQASLKIFASSFLLNVELIREFCTIVMLVCVALLASSNLKERIAYFFLAFGIWDIFYYVFLNLAIGWPASFYELDIFFLIPVAWVGPVIFPLVCSAILVIVSTLYLIRFRR